MTAIPRTFHLLGLLLATAMLLLVGYLTHMSVMYIIRYGRYTCITDVLPLPLPLGDCLCVGCYIGPPKDETAQQRA